MSHFILHKKLKGKKLSCLLAGIACVLVVAVVCYVANSMGTARAKSRETVLIYTEEELEQYLLDQENEEYNLNGRYRLEEDLELDWLYQSIGTNIEPFTGAFDGNGHVISGLGRPLFGVVEGAEIENLFLSEALIEHPFTYYDGEQYVDGYGALAAYVVNSDIRNCGMGGEIHTAVPVETEYLLAKATPADAEEVEGPGWEPMEKQEIPGVGEPVTVESGISVENPEAVPVDPEALEEGPGAAPGESTASTEDSETTLKESESAVEGSETFPVEPETGVEQPGTGVGEPGVGMEESETLPIEAEVVSTDSTEVETNGETAGLPDSQQKTDTPETSGNQEKQETDSLEAVNENQAVETVAVRMLERQYHMMKLPAIPNMDPDEVMEATPSEATPPDAETKTDVPEEQELVIALPGYVMGDGEDVFIMVKAERVTAGGLIAQAAGNTTVCDSFSCVTIICQLEELDSMIGGLVSILGQNARVENSYSSGLLDGNNLVGGFAAVHEGMIENCFSSSALTVNGRIRGAFVAEGGGRLTGCVYDRQMACVDDLSGMEGLEEEERSGGPKLTASDAEAAMFCLEGRNTVDMSGVEAVVPGIWYQTGDAYPQIEYFAQNENQISTDYSRASAVTLVLPDGMNLQDMMLGENPITLTGEMDGQKIIWSVTGDIHIDENNQIVSGAGENEETTERVENAIETEDRAEEDRSKEHFGGPGDLQMEHVNDSDMVTMSSNPRRLMTSTLNSTAQEEEAAFAGQIKDSGTRINASVGIASKTYYANPTARTVTSAIYADWREVGTAVQNDTNGMGVYKPTVGDGSEGNPYRLSTPEALAWFSVVAGTDNVNKDWCSLMTEDLDLNGAAYNNGVGQLMWKGFSSSFSGIFDGGGHTVSNVYINESGGFFGGDLNAAIRYFGIESGLIEGISYTGGFAVALAGGSIEYCYNNAQIKSKWSGAGDNYAGGACALVRGSQIKNFYNAGDVWAQRSPTNDTGSGGIAPWNHRGGGRIYNCLNTGTITSDAGTVSNRIVAITASNTGEHMNENYYRVGSAPGTQYGQAMSEEELQSWSLPYWLNGSQLKPFKQNFGAYPSFGDLSVPDWETLGRECEAGYIGRKAKPSGIGNSTNPFEITNAEQLAWFAYMVNQGNSTYCAKLLDDIDLSGIPYGGTREFPMRWTPIGTIGFPYTGTFDGNGKFISNMNVEQEGTAGLFGYVGGEAVIRKVGLAPSCRVKNVSTDDTTERGTAGLAGAVITNGTSATVTIENCYNRGTVIGRTGGKTGAFVGSCDVDGSVQKITNSYTTGQITADVGTPGAIAGSFAAYNGGTGTGISHCFWDRETSTSSGTLDAVSGGGITVNDTESMSTVQMNTSTAANAGGLIERLNTGAASDTWKRSDTMNDGYPILAVSYESWADIGQLDSSKPSLKTPSNTATAGQQANPYQIKTAAELAWFAYQVNNVAGQSGICGELKADISLFGEQYTGSTYVPGDTAGLSRALNWIPIGYSMGTTPYTGIFQGNGHTVSDMRAQGLLDMVSVGLFGSIGTGAGIYDLALSNAQLLVTGSSGGAAGGITGMIEGNGAVIKNCRNTGSLTYARTNGGTVLVGGGGITGGIDASAAGVVIKSCWNAGNIRNENTRYSGGIVGLCSTGGLQLEGCYTTAGSRVGDQADVNGQYAGGIIGGFATTASGSELKVKNCYNWGTVDGRNTAGGIIGNVGSSLNGQTIMNCYNTGTVTVSGGDNKGAIVGSGANADAASNCYHDKTLWDSSGGGGGTGIHGTGLGTEVMKSWAAAYALNGQSRSQGRGADDISWTYDPAGTSYPTLVAEGLPPAESWDQIGLGLEKGLITHDSTGFVWTKPGGTAGTGDGSEGNPYLLASAEDLAWFAYMVNSDYAGYSGKCIRLEADINLFGKPYTGYTGSTDLANITSALQWKPIGGDGKPYKGTFDGGRHEIDGMYMEGDTYLGLLGAIQYPAKIRQLGIGASSKIIAAGNDCAMVAGCIITISGGGCEITDCYNLGTLEGTGMCGAFVGDDVGNGFSGTISNCYNAGVTCSFARTNWGKIENCYADTEKNRDNRVHENASGNGVTGMTTAQMKTNEPVTVLNTLGSSGTLRTGTDRVWYTSLDAETTKGYPTLKAPTVMTVEFAQNTPVDGSSVTLKDSGGNPVTITGMKLRSFGVTDDTFTPGSTAAAGAEFSMVPYAGTAGATGVDAGVTGADSNYHKYGYTNANQNLGFLAGTVDLNGKTESLNATSLSVPVDVGLGNVSSVSLGRAAAYTKPEDRYVLLEAAGGPSGTSRYEIQMTVKGATGKTLSVTLPIKVTMANLTPDGTDHTVSGGTADYSLDLKITNHNACPIDGKILGAEINETAGYAKLQPVLPSYTLSHTGNLTDTGGGVRVGLADVGGASPAVIGAVKYYDKDAAPGTAWMKYRLKHGGYLPYRYVMEYSGLHFGPETQFGYKISYWFGVSADDYDSTADAVVTS